MSIAPTSSPYARFTDASLRDRVIGSLQRRYEQTLGSDEVEDAYGQMLERLSKLTVDELEAIQNPATWMFVGMRSRLQDRLRLRGSNDVRFDDIPDSDVLDDVLSDHDDPVVGSVIGREAAGERIAHVAELVWLKFTGADGQIAARILLEDAKPQAVASELGLDPAYVSTVAHKAHQERRLLERKLKENPEFRCWRLRKHTSNYYASGEVSLALRAHWVTCAKCRAAQCVAREQTRAALGPLLPGAAVATGGGGLLARLLHHATRPGRTARRLLRPAGHAGANAGASSTQLATVSATVTSKAAVIATVAVIGTTAAGATTVAAVRHFAHHTARRALTQTQSVHSITPSPVAPPVTEPATKPLAPPQTASHPQRVVKHVKRVVKHAKRAARPKRKRRRITAHITKEVVAAAPPVAQTTTVSQTTTTVVPAATTTQAPPATHTTPATTPSSSGSVTNPSYSTPNAP